MQFGQRKADAPARDGNYLRRFKKGETKVRLLQNTDDWYEYWEHFINRQGFPCTRDKQTCPGCTHESEDVQKASRKYATYIQVVSNKQVLPFSITASLCDRFETRQQRNDGTLLNRDFVVMRSGDGFDTEYDVDTEEKYDVDTEALLKEAREKYDLNEILLASFNEVWGEDAKPARATEERERKQDADPPSEAGADQSSNGAGNEVLTEAQVRAMEKPQLRDLCDKAGLKWDSDDSKSELVDKLLAAFGD